MLKDLLLDFKLWMNDYPITRESSTSYVSYAKNYLVQLNQYTTGKYKYDLLANIKKSNKIKPEDINLLLTMDRACNIVKNQIHEKTFYNYRSGFRLLSEFLFDTEQYCFDQKGSEQFQQDYNSAIDIVYSKSIMKKIFISRLITQDRKLIKDDLPADQLMYPARLINRILNNSCVNDEYKEMLNKLVDGIRLYYDKTDNTKFKCFDSVTRLVITEKAVEFKSKNSKKEMTLLTNSKGKLIPLIASKGIRDISIDHNIPIDDQLTNHSGDYPLIGSLTRMIMEAKKKVTKATNQSLSSTAYEENQKTFTDEFCKDLLKEIEKMNNEIDGFVLMHQSDNSSKGNKQ